MLTTELFHSYPCLIRALDYADCFRDRRCRLDLFDMEYTLSLPAIFCAFSLPRNPQTPYG